MGEGGGGLVEIKKTVRPSENILATPLWVPMVG